MNNENNTINNNSNDTTNMNNANVIDISSLSNIPSSLPQISKLDDSESVNTTESIHNNSVSKLDAGNNMVPNDFDINQNNNKDSENTQPTESVQNNNASRLDVDNNSGPANFTISQKNNNNNDTEYIDEKLKSAEINYKPPSKGKIFLLIFFFIIVLVYILFLPDINSLIDKYKSGDTEIVVKDITTGKLVCSYKTNNETLDMNYERVFRYTDNKLQSAVFTTVTRGDVSADADKLSTLNNNCELLEKEVSTAEGISIRCTLSSGTFEQVESFTYGLFTYDEISSAYSEAGGSILEFHQGDDIENVATTMRRNNFECKKEK